MPAHSSVAKARQGTPYRHLATNGGEICRLAWRRDRPRRRELMEFLLMQPEI